MLGPDVLRETTDVGDHSVPAGGTNNAITAELHRCPAVPAVVVGVDRVPRSDENSSDAPVSPGMLRCTMRNLDRGLGRPYGYPTINVDPLTIRPFKGKCVILHRFLNPHAPRITSKLTGIRKVISGGSLRARAPIL